MEFFAAVGGLVGGVFMGFLFCIFAFFALSAGKEVIEEKRISLIFIVMLFGTPAIYIIWLAFENIFSAIGFIVAVAAIYYR